MNLHSRGWGWATLLAVGVGCGGGGTEEVAATAVLPSFAPSSGRQIRVHYDAGPGNWISIRGDAAPLSWETGMAATWTEGNVWVWPVPGGLGSVHFKPVLNDSLWSVGADYEIPAEGSVDLYPFFGPSKGSLWIHSGFTSSALQNTRSVIVYRPPSYFENAAKHYPVLYMHDGQNLFQGATSATGIEWGVDEMLDGLIGAGEMREVIVVGIYNTAKRLDEYTPSYAPGYGGGQANAYLDFIENVVMPFVDANYRTLQGPQNTSMLGASFGGLVSFYAGWTRSSVYGAAGAMSASFWWNNQALTKQVEQFPGPKIPARFYLDEGGQEPIGNTVIRLRKALSALGYQFGVDLVHWFDPDGSHDEASWTTRLPIVLPFIVGTD